MNNINKSHPVLFVLFTILADFLIIMDAGAFGYWIGKEILPFDKLIFWAFIILAGVFRYVAEKLK
jgi:hypothetical protein